MCGRQLAEQSRTYDSLASRQRTTSENLHGCTVRSKETSGLQSDCSGSRKMGSKAERAK